MKPLILLVEHHPLDLELTVIALEKSCCPHHLYVARDGEEALRFLLEGQPSDHRRPSLVLLDLQLPKINGIEVLKRIRSTPSLSNLPVIALSSTNEEADKNRVTALGITQYLVKPMEWHSFSDVLQSALSSILAQQDYGAKKPAADIPATG